MARCRGAMAAAAAAVLAAATAVPAVANDGFAGLATGGLEFTVSPDVEMVEEDLFLSPAEVRVEYLFRNHAEEDVAGMVVFPLPPLSPSAPATPEATAPELAGLADLNYLGFTVTVDGAPVAFTSDVRLVLPPDEWAWSWDLLRHPGRDVTDELHGLGLPPTLDLAALRAWFVALPPPERARLTAAGVFAPVDAEQEELRGAPLYVAVVRFSWRQTFPAGRDVRIAHRYRPVKGGSVFSVDDELRRDYCVDPPTERALRALEARAVAGWESGGGGGVELVFLDYILTTATTWKGPVGSFRMTVDKGAPDAVVSLCMDGLRRTGPTTFAVEKKNFRPQRDLRLLLARYHPAE